MKQKDIFYIVVSSFVLIVIWIAFNLWHIRNTNKLSDTVIIQSTPINATFDTATLEKLKERSQTSPNFTVQISSQSAATPTPSPTIRPSPSALPTLPIEPTEIILNPTP